MALISCTKCGANISEKAITCPKCGSSEPFKKEEFGNCAECFAKIPLHSNPCPNCGYPNPVRNQELPKSNLEHTIKSPSITPLVQEKGRTGLGIVIGLIISIIILFTSIAINLDTIWIILSPIYLPIIFGILGYLGIFGRAKNLEGSIQIPPKKYRKIMEKNPESLCGKYEFGGIAAWGLSELIYVLIPLWHKTTTIFMIFTNKGIIMAFDKEYYFVIRKFSTKFFPYTDVTKISLKKPTHRDPAPSFSFRKIETPTPPSLKLYLQSLEIIELKTNVEFLKLIEQHYPYLKNVAANMYIEVIEEIIEKE